MTDLSRIRRLAGLFESKAESDICPVCKKPELHTGQKVCTFCRNKEDDEEAAKEREEMGESIDNSYARFMAEGGGWDKTNWDDCEECNGTGREESDNGPSPKETQCGNCDGEGGWPKDAVEESAEDRMASALSLLEAGDIEAAKQKLRG